MLAYDVAAANGRKTNSFRVSCPGNALSVIDRIVREISVQRRGKHLADPHRSTRGSINLMLVVSLNDFYVNLIAQGLRRNFD